MSASRDVCIYISKKTWRHLRCLFYLYKEFTSHLNVECIESTVPEIFLSHAPNFFSVPDLIRYNDFVDSLYNKNQNIIIYSISTENNYS